MFYSSWFDAVKKMARQEGLSGFYKVKNFDSENRQDRILRKVIDEGEKKKIEKRKKKKKQRKEKQE